MTSRPAARRRGERMDARALAWDILRRVEETQAFADVLLGSRLAAAGLERRDEALVTQLVYGTLAWRGFLDRAIESFSSRRSATIEPAIRVLLELALFQIFKLDRIPDYAAVDRAVELSKMHGHGRASGFVNAVLRRATAAGEGGVLLPDPSADFAAHLAARDSHPQWLVRRWLAELGREETEALLRANNEAPPTVVRVNRVRSTRAAEVAKLAECAAVPTRWALDGVRVEGISPLALPGYAAGELSVQSEASQLVTLLLGARPGERILDTCAGNGAKSTHIAECTRDAGRVVAVDPHVSSLRHLGVETRRLGLTSIARVCADATQPPFSVSLRFDRILVDAPCSGLGTLRGHPEIRWRRTPADVTSGAALQRRLLHAAIDRVRAGGCVVYAACTILAEETDEVVATVVEARSDVEREDARATLPPAAAELVEPSGALRTFPHRHGLDGFYAVRLKRR